MKTRFDFDSFREVGDALMRNKSRSFLTGFGIFWGIFMLLMLMGAGNGFKSQLLKEMGGFATNTAVVVSSNTSVPYKGFKEGRYWSITDKDVDRLKELVPELEVVTPMISNWGQTAVHGKYSRSTNVKGVSDDFVKTETPNLKYGRYINSVDVKYARKVCVLGKEIYEALFPEGGDPCGQLIQVGSVYMKVIGVDVASGNMNINGRNSEAIVIPVTLAAQLYNRGKNVDILCVTGKKGVKMTQVEDRIRAVMSRAHDFDPKDREAMMYLNAEEIFQIVDNLERGLNFIIWLVGIGTLLAGAIGVSNIMMVTVRERTTEIGIRRAIGAVPKDIVMQIISESVTLTLLAGTAGIVIPVLILQGLESASKGGSTFQISFWIAVSALLLLTVLGVLAGLAPALRAMKVKPVDAMRDE